MSASLAPGPRISTRVPLHTLCDERHLRELRCLRCNALLQRVNLAPGTRLEIRCWRKTCRSIHTVEADQVGVDLVCA